jgi:hypothetical protein
MPLLNTIMIWGTAAVAIPIIIHLMNRRRFRKVPWAAIRFLKISVERNQRRMKIEEWILLLLRCAIVALIAFALARPVSDLISGRWLASQTVAGVVIDHSGSMATATGVGGKTKLDTAREAATGILSGLPNGSATSVVSAADTPGEGVLEPTLDSSRADRAVEEIRQTYRTTDLLPAIDGAADAIENRAATRRELIIITDGQSAGWKQFDAIIRRLETAKTKARPVIVLVGEPGVEGDNLAVTRLAQNTPVAAIGQPLRLSVEVTNFGPLEADNVTVQLSVDGAEAGEPVDIGDIPPGESRAVTTFAALPGEGHHRIAATLPGGDSLPLDDTRVIVVRAVKRSRALLVDGEPGRVPSESETFFLHNALVPVPPDRAEDFYIAADVVTPSALPGTDLDDYDAIFLANVSELTRSSAQQIADFVGAGGGLAVFPGKNVNRSFYNVELHSELGLLPAGFGDAYPEDSNGPGLTLQAGGYDHPLVALWNDPGAGTLASARTRRALRLEIPKSETGGQTAPGTAKVVLRYDDGSPAVVEGEFGLGRVFQFSSSADTEWTDLPVRLGFLPLIHRVFGGVLQRKGGGLNVQVGSPFVRRFPSEFIQREAMVYAAGTAVSEGTLIKVQDLGGGAAGIEYANTDLAGTYEVSLTDPPEVISFATQMDPAESDPEPLSEPQLERLRSVADVVRWEGPGSLAAVLGNEGSGGSEIWLPLIVIAGLLALLELFLAQRFSRVK